MHWNFYQEEYTLDQIRGFLGESAIRRITHWHIGILAHLPAGRQVGTLAHWHIGTLAHWHIDILFIH